MKKSIYPARSQRVNEIFKSARDPSKVLVVPLDFGKEEHSAQFCLGTGEYLRNKPLRVYNNSRGAEYLKEHLEKTIKRGRFLKENVLIASEDPPSYLLNFIHRFRSLGYIWTRVNAREAKKLRSTARASSDSIDLSGIVQALRNRRAKELEEFDETYHAMKRAARSRRKFVRDETAAKNRIHECVDVLFPGFLKPDAAIVPFSEPSLSLMESRFSSIKIARMRFETLARNLRKHHVQNPEHKAKKLKDMAKAVNHPTGVPIACYQRSLTVKVAHLRSIRASIKCEENEMARRLVRTPGFYLTSIPGVGVPLAGHVIAEMGNPLDWLPVDNMSSYSGIVSRQHQTGGHDKPPIKSGLPLDCNHVLKDYLLQIAYHVGTTPMPILKELPVDGEHTLEKHYHRLENANARSRLGTAKKFLRIAKCLVKQERIYLPAEWVNYDTGVEIPTDLSLRFYESQVATLRSKWRKYDLSDIDPDKNYLLKEERAIDDLKRLKNQS